jgi:hypothetical protein
MVTQMSPVAQEPPVVAVAVATSVVPMKISKFVVVAEAAGTMANAISTKAKTVSLILVIRTTQPPLGTELVLQ